MYQGALHTLSRLFARAKYIIMLQLLLGSRLQRELGRVSGDEGGPGGYDAGNIVCFVLKRAVSVTL